MRFFTPVVLAAAMILAARTAALAQSCPAGPATVQILGSGGPAVNPERASASYLLWVDGQARVLVDMGGGAFLRFGQSGAKTSDLALVAISHLHPDHVSDLPAFLWLSHTIRTEPLPIVGPSAGKGAAGPAANDGAPEFQTFLSRLFDEKTGAFQVLGGALGWLAGIGALLIPGLGAFIAAGPIVAALSGAVVGAGLGGLTGMLVPTGRL